VGSGIRIEKAESPGRGRRSVGAFQKKLLDGELPGVSCVYRVVGRGSPHAIEPCADDWKVFLVFAGRGVITAADRAFTLEEKAVFVPGTGARCIVEADGAPVELLEIRTDRLPADRHHEETLSGRAPWFQPYSRSTRYRESIKSAATINRTLLPVGIIPRLAMGSVEAKGPDRVEAHRHPELEQLFFGLPGNGCIVEIDGRDVAFPERALLRIPRGSLHGVRVDAGSTMHYVWLDFFRNEADMTYISRAHDPIAPGDP
jgi:quercetin dioxygenase-like cupin family protein